MQDMLGRGEAVSAAKAHEFIFKNYPRKELRVEKVLVSEALGRVVAEEVISGEDLPGFARSTMDGYAVSAADTFGASEGAPAYLKVSNEIMMGQEPDFSLKKGETAKIATGGMIPDGADAVVMLEHVQSASEGIIEVTKSVAPGDNVIQRGEDVSTGALVFPRGRRIGACDMGVLAGLGFTVVPVFERPVVTIISTGDEIVPADSPLKPGLVRDMNSYVLRGLVLRDGGEPGFAGILGDDERVLSDTLADAAERSSVVLITGGSSVGTRDLTEKVIAGLGEVLFHSVSIKPGKPLMTGKVGDCLVFGLPGHPRAVAVCYGVFVQPVIERLSGFVTGEFTGLKQTVTAKLKKAVHSAAGRRDVISVALERNEGQLWAVPLMGKSGLITMMARADGVVSVPEDVLGCEQGADVTVTLL